VAKLFNLARMTTATTGTGTITLGSAVGGFLTFAQAGVSNGESVAYGISDGNNSEVGTGTYTSSGTTLTRSVTTSTNSNNPINLSGSAQVYILARAQDILNPANNLSDVQSGEASRASLGAMSNYVLHMQDQKSSGTSGGGLTSGGFTQRALNTVVTNTITGASLSSNQFTLPAGTFLLHALVPGYFCGFHQGLIYDVSGAADFIYGTPEYSPASGVADSSQTTSKIRKIFTIGSSKTFEVEQRCSTTNSSNGRGVPVGFGHIEIYTDVLIQKL
jgi:hypothetical protein